MWLINGAMRRPITILVAVIAIIMGAFLAYTRMSVDIFPDLNLPVIYVAQPYGGMDPSQMQVDPERRARQALLSPGHGYEPGSGPDCLLRGARPRLHATRDCRTFRRAL